jgi:glycine oxidase
VAVIDAGEIGRGASWAGAGILPPTPKTGAIDPYEQMRAMSHELHREWARRLLRDTGIDTGYHRCGGVYLATTPGEVATLAANRLWWDEHGIEYEAWSTEDLVRREPNLADFAHEHVKSAWFLPDECQLRNPRHLKALALACFQHGVEFHSHRALEKLSQEQGRVTGVTASGQNFTAEQVCICTGAWARGILEGLGFENGIMPVRGQMLLYACPRPPLQRVVNEGHRYLVPRDDGFLLAGSVEEEVGYVVETTEVAVTQIRSWAETVLPQLRQCNIEKSWAGLRPGSYDGFPYIGGVPGVENLYVAAGHFRSGLHLSCATAVLLADLLEGKTSQIDMQPFRIGR